MRVRLTVQQLALFAWHLWQERGLTFDDLRRMGRAQFIDQHVTALGDEREWECLVRPTEAEIAAMYDEMLLLWATSLTPTSDAVN